ncbi:MAG: acyl-CoA thioesterase [Chitinophagaceae bacterium]|nr:acyl-CoA thioesterase [Chitinophagaceae bacterium]
MSRIKIDLPEKFAFTTTIPVRITDINYGGHTGNDTILSLIHEARIQFLRSIGYTELDFGGTGMIMVDVGIEFKTELFYGDIVIASVTPADIGKASFDVYYKLEKETDGKRIIVAIAKTGMVCYDYDRKKIVALAKEAAGRLKG